MLMKMMITIMIRLDKVTIFIPTCCERCLIIEHCSTFSSKVRGPYMHRSIGSIVKNLSFTHQGQTKSARISLFRYVII